MRQETERVFSEYVNGGGVTVFTSLEHTALLSRADQLVLQAVVDLGNDTATSPTLSIAVQHCGDGRSWMPKNASAELTGALTKNGRTVLWGSEGQKPRPSLRFVRLAITLNTVIAARVEVHVTARSLSQVWSAECGAEGGGRGGVTLMGNVPVPLRHGTLTELQRLTHDWRHRPTHERHAGVRAHLSKEALHDVGRFVEHLRVLPAHEKQRIVASAQALQVLLALVSSPANAGGGEAPCAKPCVDEPAACGDCASKG